MICMTKTLPGSFGIAGGDRTVAGNRTAVIVRRWGRVTQ
jgi:hypothetical protein